MLSAFEILRRESFRNSPIRLTGHCSRSIFRYPRSFYPKGKRTDLMRIRPPVAHFQNRRTQVKIMSNISVFAVTLLTLDMWLNRFAVA